MDKIEQWTEQGFIGLDSNELREAARVVGVNIDGIKSDGEILGKLRAAVNLPPVATLQRVGVETVSPSQRCTDRPSLSASDWKGRRRTVVILATQQDQENNPNVRAMLGWEGIPIYVKYGVPADIGEPWYNSLVSARGKIINVTYENRGSDQPAERKETTREYQTHGFQDLGVTKGTENLPGSLLEWYQWEAERNDCFERKSERALRAIYGELYMMTPERVLKREHSAVSKDEVRYGVLEFLGPKYAARMQFDDDEPAPTPKQHKDQPAMTRDF